MAPSPQPRHDHTPKVAVLGGTIAGVLAAQELAGAGLAVDVFSRLFDPARSIHTPHPFCEYQAATFTLREDDPAEFAAAVRQWQAWGLVDPAPGFRASAVGPDGRARPLAVDGVRYRPRGGFFALLEGLLQRLPGTVRVCPAQLCTMHREAGAWRLRDVAGGAHGPYDAVLCTHDALPRAARKAALKQLLESALPHTGRVMACAARAVSASAMAVVVGFDAPLAVAQDSVVVEGVPELRVAARNAAAEQAGRGLRHRQDTWTLVATPEWTEEQRPTHAGAWDKRRVGDALLRAFGRVLGVDASKGRPVVPPFHWQGCSPVTCVRPGAAACAFDAAVGVGWCGDVFAGIGPAAAWTSARALTGAVLAALRADGAAEACSVLPGEGMWVPRVARAAEDDVACVVGPTGRREPQDGLDHTWPAAVQLAQGVAVTAADSLRRYRAAGVLERDRQRLAREGAGSPAPPTAGGPRPVEMGGVAAECRAGDEAASGAVEEGPQAKARAPTRRRPRARARLQTASGGGDGANSTAHPPAKGQRATEGAAAKGERATDREAAKRERAADNAAAAPRRLPSPASGTTLVCEELSEGLLRLRRLPRALQDRLLAAVFPVGARGVCGGLWDRATGRVEGPHGAAWPVEGVRTVPLSGLGLHGRHCLELPGAGGAAVAAVLGAAAAAAPALLRAFAPDCLQVAFETLGGRRLRAGQTLCGWSRDGDRAGARDAAPKVCVALGAATVTRSYKYSREDRASLDVELAPGDVLVVSGPARQWVSAVSAVRPGADPAPFDFAHVWLADHRPLRRARPDVYRRIHDPPTPRVGDGEYRWMQSTYTVVTEAREEAGCVLEVRGHQ